MDTGEFIFPSLPVSTCLYLMVYPTNPIGQFLVPHEWDHSFFRLAAGVTTVRDAVLPPRYRFHRLE